MAAVFNPEDLLDLAPLVEKTAKQSAFRYRYRLMQMPAIDGEDFIGVGWRRLIEKHQALDVLAGEYRSNLARKMCRQAIDDEMKRLQESVTLVPMTPQGTIAGGKDLYDGGRSAFADDDVIPAHVQPAANFWNPPRLWDSWKRMKRERRTLLLAAAGVCDAFAKSKWSDIPEEEQDKIEDCWKRWCYGYAEKNRASNNETASFSKRTNCFRFAKYALPHTDELLCITPPRLRAIALMVYRGGFYADGDNERRDDAPLDGPFQFSINSGAIAQTLEEYGYKRDPKTFKRQHEELLRLWCKYIKAPVSEKKDRYIFPAYTPPKAVARELEQLPEGFAMPERNPIVDELMMSQVDQDILDIRTRVFHTDFSESIQIHETVTPTPETFVLNGESFLADYDPRRRKHYGMQTRVPEAENHTRTIDSFWNGEEWQPIRSVSDKGSSAKNLKLQMTWLHDWSAHRNLFGEKPTRLFLTTQRTVAPALSVSPAQITMSSAFAQEPSYPRVRTHSSSCCSCPLCREMRRLDRLHFDEARAKDIFRDSSDLDDDVLYRSVRRIGILHGYSTTLGDTRYRGTHFIRANPDGSEVWLVEETLLAGSTNDEGKTVLREHILTTTIVTSAIRDFIELPAMTFSERIPQFEIIVSPGAQVVTWEDWIARKQKREPKFLPARSGEGHLGSAPTRIRLGSTIGLAGPTAEVIAEFTSKRRKESTKKNAAENAAIREWFRREPRDIYGKKYSIVQCHEHARPLDDSEGQDIILEMGETDDAQLLSHGD